MTGSTSVPQEARDERAPMVVAVDGPAGSGKSSVCRESARRLGFGYLDTGAAYRALTWFAIDSGCDLDDATAVAALLPSFVELYSISQSPDERWVRVGETDVSEFIRDTAISGDVWRVSRVPAAREALTALFRRTMAATTSPGIIAEGRDITTVVAADAPARILMTADEAVRIARRCGSWRRVAARPAASVSRLMRSSNTASTSTDSLSSWALSTKPGVRRAGSTKVPMPCLVSTKPEAWSLDSASRTTVRLTS